MREITTDIAVIGVDSAGLSAASAGADVLVIDENHLPGGQLFKQIHKFFRLARPSGRHARLPDRAGAARARAEERCARVA